MKEVKKIVHLGYMHKYSDTRIFEKECKSLNKIENIEVYFITSDRHGFFEGEIDRISIKTIPLVKKRFIKLVKYITMVKKICLDLDADIYHIHEFVLLPLVKFLKKKGKKVIYDKHEDTFGDVYKQMRRSLGDKIAYSFAKKYEKYEEKLIRLSDGYIYVTPQHRLNDLIDKSIMIPNFPKLYEDIGISVNKKNDEEKLTIAYCGGVVPIWSIEEFANIVKKSENLKLVLAGKSNQNYIEKIVEDDNNNAINYLGSIPFKEVKDIYKNADVGIALLKKNLGEKLNTYGTLANTKIFEYMQAGLPVIFTDFPIWIDINKEYNFGISVDLDDKQQIIGAIEYLRNNREEALKMGENGKKAIKDKYNWEVSEKEFLEFYRSILKD